jgi:DNA polymerase
MPGMRDDYHRLLESTIEYLEQLRDEGHKYVSVSADVLEALEMPAAPVRPREFAAPERRVLSVPEANPVEPSKTSGDTVGADPASETAEEPESGAQVVTPRSKEKEMADLRARALACVKCPHLARARKNVVFGGGDIQSPLMFVGEAPGADEDEQGEPFVGRAGQLLTRIIETMGFSRSTVYIANVLKCRPDTPGQTSGNRKPTGEEMQTCLPYLQAQIDLIEPRVIVALGATAVQGLFGKADGITKIRGRFQTFRQTPVMPTYHPAYLLRNPNLKAKREVWEDMLQVMETLGLSITEKQRNYFLKA